MKEQEFLITYWRFLHCRTIQDCIDFLNILENYLLNVVSNHHHDKVANHALEEAKLVNQMISTKVAYLKKSLGGIDFSSRNIRLNKIIDPTIIACLIRNLYETIAMFNLVYIQPKNDDERLILYNLWVHSGWSYRQKFEKQITTQEHKDKHLEEKKMLDSLRIEIENSSLYKSLTSKSQGIIKNKLERKDYKIVFDESENVIGLSWQDILNYWGLKNNMLDNIYTYFSLYAHPSNVSVCQFAVMFDKENPDFEVLSITNMRTAFALISVFIADYIKLFPNVLNTFEGLPLEQQIILNFYNKMMRGDEKSINDAWKNLE